MVYTVIVQSDLVNTLLSSKPKFSVHCVETRKKNGVENELSFVLFDISDAVED